LSFRRLYILYYYEGTAARFLYVIYFYCTWVITRTRCYVCMIDRNRKTIIDFRPLLMTYLYHTQSYKYILHNIISIAAFVFYGLSCIMSYIIILCTERVYACVVYFNIIYCDRRLVDKTNSYYTHWKPVIRNIKL